MGDFIRRGGFISLICIVVAAVLGAFWLSERATGHALENRGVVTAATVDGMRVETTRRYTKNGTQTDTDYLVTYTYETIPASGATPVLQRVRCAVPEWVYEDLSFGQKVEIRYLPEDATRADVYPGEATRTARILGWFALVLLATAAVLAGVARWAGRRHNTGAATLA